MEKLYKSAFLILLISIFSFSAKAQALEDVVNGMRSSNVTMLTKYFDSYVAITMNNNQSVYSKTQAEMVLKDFFAKNTIKDFDIVQNGTSGNDSKYAIGKLITMGATYQLYLVLKVKGSSYILQEIRFEKP